MKRLVFFTLGIFLLQVTVSSQSTNQLNGVATLLFKNVRSKLTVDEKNKIAAMLGFVLSGNTNEPFAQDKDSKEYPFNASVYTVDLNKDGKEEVFIVFGNSYTSGQTGSSLVLYIKNAAGSFLPHLGFPCISPDVLVTNNLGFPDLLIGGPSFEYPVYRWNGKTYDLFKKIKDAAYSQLKKTTLEDLSKAYQKSIQ